VDDALNGGEAFPPKTSVFIKHKGVSTPASVIMVPIDFTDTSWDYHFYTVNLVTGVNIQVSQEMSSNPYKSSALELQHDDASKTILVPL
jgi:hypothetical protein